MKNKRKQKRRLKLFLLKQSKTVNELKTNKALKNILAERGFFN